MWGIKGGNSWICVRQDDDNDYTIQLRLMDFKLFSTVKKRIIEILEASDCRLNDEYDEEGFSFGYCKNFVFIDTRKYDAMKETELLLASERQSSTYIGTQITGEIHHSGGNFQVGNNSTASINNVSSEEKHWFSKEVVKSILTFLSGVCATLLTQYLMRLLDWIQ